MLVFITQSFHRGVRALSFAFGTARGLIDEVPIGKPCKVQIDCAVFWNVRKLGMREKLIYQGVGEWGNRAEGDGERTTRHTEASSIPYHEADSVI